MKNFVDAEAQTTENQIHGWANQSLFEYGHSLKQKGWHFNAKEGGYISPNYSAVFICGPDPREGQLLKYEKGSEKDYQKILNSFLKSGEFIQCSAISTGDQTGS